MDFSKSSNQRVTKRLEPLDGPRCKARIKFGDCLLQENHIRCLPTPANSPDLKAVENVWGMIDFEVKKMKFAGKVWQERH
jgi:hypothetical protein